MYNLFKSIVKKMLPKDQLVKHEELLRKFTIPFYYGKNHQCNVCYTQLKKFATIESGELICPVCGSLPRSRRLYQLLIEDYLKSDLHVLDFSPFRVLYRKLKKIKTIHYYPSDFEDDFLSDYHYDMTNIDTANDQFDLIVCYHILEHIIDDEKAMSELYRVLKKGGLVLVQTPFKEGEIYEDYSITTPEDRLQHFGQDNHVRIYSLQGLEERLQNAGFSTEIKNFDGDFYYGFSENEKVIFCKK